MRLHEYRAFAEAEANLARSVAEVYNRKRLVSSSGYLPPSEIGAATSRPRGARSHEPTGRR
ncbi:MAG: hypothetical protein AVDCRST_MAG19-4136 [uncultured Thermomicrobiales bacterium]|uniref:Integrase catalytic domain-containing protein n=1 Tax=uncultured Thermomicrobiales bacterium TaxID=1645740 RepID=A0A6J4VLA0_9BACT|nr:MAG: hypothetical protein AVDCRST_MAG19-4136 [uncultured Thermomicrobiales bacterium]